MKTFKIYLIMTLFVSSLFGMSDEKYIKDALLKYNYGIIKMAKTGETQFFKEFVSKDVAMKLQVWFESWRFSNLTFVADINDIRFGPIKYNENNATLRTIENWSFFYVNLATKELALEPIKMFYEMQYTLKKDNGKWMIVDVKHLREEKFEKTKPYKPELSEDKSPQKGEKVTPR